MRQDDSEGTALINGSSVAALKRRKRSQRNSSNLHRFNGFALYEVLLGVTIFAVGVVAVGREVENCLNASILNAEEERVRQILSNGMAEIQAAPGFPDTAKEFKINTGYGIVKLIQKSAPADLTEPGNIQLSGIYLATLSAQWTQGGVAQSKQISFYVYRAR